MDMDSMQGSQNKFLFSLAAALIVGGIVGVVIDPYLPSALSNAKKSYQAGFSAARKVAEESQYGSFFRTQSDVRSLSGVVATVSDDHLTLKVSSMMSPFDDAALAERTVRTTSDTKVVRLVAKDSKVFQAELAKFSSVPSATPPSPYTLVAGSVADIKTGDSLTVTASENVAGMKEFIASEVRIELGISSR
jgi:hypothetical protein